MKKIIILGIFAITAGLANASYLYWQVSGAGLGGEEGAYTFNGNAVTGLRMTYSTDNGATRTAFSDTSAYSYLGEEGATTTISAPLTPKATPSDYYVNLTGFENTTYSYFVEIVGGGNQVLGYAKYTDYAANNSLIITDFNDTQSLSNAAAAWTSPVYAVPEPTGAVLMIFGLAMLGLKRRKV